MSDLAKNVLICGVNWLGDGIMTMPAVQALKRESSCRITMLVKPKLLSLWGMHPSVDEVLALGEGLAGILRTVRQLRSRNFDVAYIFPNSFRSALIPFLARVPERVGVSGHQRSWMLTRKLGLMQLAGKDHQAWEYLHIMGLLEGDRQMEPAVLDVSGLTADSELGHLFSDDAKDSALIGFIPGAAYGDAKRWPENHFIEVGRHLVSSRKCRIVLFGTAGERSLCERISSAVGENAFNMAGETSLVELAALLGRCDVVVCNDSGGMHLAAAAGTKVVAVFGMTDPVKTGPMGSEHSVITRDDVSHSRDIERDSPEAIACMHSIEPARVERAVTEILP